MSNLIEHAKREFLALGYKPIEQCEDDPNKWIQENVLELLKVFSDQGHSGFSAPYAVRFFQKLALFEPLCPITGDTKEWNDINETMGKMIYQNNRCSAVFKEGEDGKPYYIDAIVWKTQNESCYTGSALLKNGTQIRSRQFIKLPFTPKSFYIDVIEKEIAPDDFEFYVKDETQLEEVWEYYEKLGI